MTKDDQNRAKELAALLNRTTEAWRRTQYEPVKATLIRAAVKQLMKNQGALPCSST